MEIKKEGAGMGVSKQLAVPEAGLRDQESFEVARVWVAEKAQHVSLLIGTWNDPVAWGIVLADLARHVANGYAQNKGLGAEEIVRRMAAAFRAELESPTDHPSGKIQTNDRPASSSRRRCLGLAGLGRPPSGSTPRRPGSEYLPHSNKY
jgi:hypothetical protein